MTERKKPDWSTENRPAYRSIFSAHPTYTKEELKAKLADFKARHPEANENAN